MFILGRRSLTLYLCVPYGIYCESQEASSCIFVFHEVFTVGRWKHHPVSLCSMRYLLWVTGSITLYLCVPCGIYCGSQEASPCIFVFHAVFTVGHRKHHPVSSCSMRYLLWVAGSLTLYLCVPCGIYYGLQEASTCIFVFHAVFTVGRSKPEYCLAFAEKHGV